MSKVSIEGIVLQGLIISSTLAVSDAFTTAIKEIVGKPADQAVAKLLYAGVLVGSTIAVANSITAIKKASDKHKQT